MDATRIRRRNSTARHTTHHSQETHLVLRVNGGIFDKNVVQILHVLKRELVFRLAQLRQPVLEAWHDASSSLKYGRLVPPLLLSLSCPMAYPLRVCFLAPSIVTLPSKPQPQARL